jgi:hypothetical protein
MEDTPFDSNPEQAIHYLYFRSVLAELLQRSRNLEAWRLAQTQWQQHLANTTSQAQTHF